MAAAVFVWLLVLVLVGSVMGVWMVSRRRRPGGGQRSPGQEVGLIRVRARVATGCEQAVVGLISRLGLSVESAETLYGEMYLVSMSDTEVLIRSRSEIGRGFLGVLRFEKARRGTEVIYSIVRLPLDEQIRESVQALELKVVLAVRDLDRTAEVQLNGSALSSGLR